MPISEERFQAMQETLQQGQKDITDRLDAIQHGLHAMDVRLSILEAKNGHKIDEVSDELVVIDKRLIKLEDYQQVKKASWDRIIDALYKVAVALVGAYLIFKLGFKP